MRALIWVQHIWGVGHLRRMTRIADALGAEGARVTLVTGGLPVPALEQGAFALERLPPVRAADPSCRILTDADGNPAGSGLMNRRAGVLLRLFERAAPDILVTELFPFGRRKFRHELLALLERAHSRHPRPLILCSLRDIPEPPSGPDRIRDQLWWAHQYYDALLVHGDPALVELAEVLPHAARLHLPVHHTGHVTAVCGSRNRRPCGRMPEIVVSAGGGRSGARLLQTAAEAAPLVTGFGPLRWRLIGGWHGEKSRHEQNGDNRSGCEILHETARSDLPVLLADAALSISRAGYNTVGETLAGRTRMILVPDQTGGQCEQTLRARRLAERGLAMHLPESGLSPKDLAEAAAEMLGRPHPRHRLRLDGAFQSARLIAELWERHRAAAGMAPRPVTR